MFLFPKIRIIFNCLIDLGNRINFVHYLYGILFYVTAGYATLDSLKIQGSSQNIPFLMVIFVLFIICSCIQYQSHVILADYRRNNICSKESYYIPRGGLFNHICCPHYFSEILIYYCILEFGQRSNLWLALFVFVLSNQTIASLISHRWYQNYFGNKYPKHLKAIIPFVL